jgi:hypothetical protein
MPSSSKSITFADGDLSDLDDPREVLLVHNMGTLPL